MLSIRSFARSAPRAVSRLSSSSIKTPILRQTSRLQSAFRPARAQCIAPFSTSRISRSKLSESDEELVGKLESEISMEKDLQENEDVPTSVQDYLQNGPFEVVDTPGQEQVVLTRQFGDEKIRVSFSIADLNNLDPEADYQDRALGDEEESDNINQGDEKEFKSVPEDQVGEEGEEQDAPYPIRVDVVVEKSGKGALLIEAYTQDGMMVIDNVSHYANAAHAHAVTPEAYQERQDLYSGPPFNNLDQDLQVLMDKYLEERGVNAALAIFIPEYIDMKEQKEYVRWLSNVKDFVEA